MALLAALATTGCAYLNTFYNAERAYEKGVRLSRAGGDTLTAEARVEFERAAEKSAVVLARYGDSDYADDALFLLGRSLQRLGSHADAAETFRRYLQRFPDSEESAVARLALTRSERLQGDFAAARAALEPLLAGGGEIEDAELLYEKALMEQGTGDHSKAVASFRELLDRHPTFARDRQVALQFADAEMAAGRHEAALEAYQAFHEHAVDLDVRNDAALRIARALGIVGRRDGALAAYSDVLEEELPDSLAAEIHAEQGDLFAADSAWAEAEAAYRRAAELWPGTEIASRATLRRGRISWRAEGERGQALDTLLDAFLHAPASAYGDSARAEARALARVIHYEELASGDGPVAGIDDPALARSTALYRLAEEILDAEADPVAAAAVFERLSERYPGSPWRPRALLAAGILHIRSGAQARGESVLGKLVEEYPDTAEADSARRTLGIPIPERPLGFYGSAPELVTLAAALPRAEDPMLRIIDQLDRYADRRPDSLDDRIGGRRGRVGQPGAGPGIPGSAEREPPEPGAETDTEEPQGPPRPSPQIPEGVTP